MLNPAPDQKPVFTLTAIDRCDKRDCNARAYIRVTMSDMRELLFCAHHGREVEPVLRPIAAFWSDETDAVLLKTGSVTEV
nr:hypothetical protein [Cryobacterium sp. Y57]